MLATRPGSRYLLLLSALAAAVSCSDRTQLVNPLNPRDANRATAAPPQGTKVKVKQLQLSSNKPSIDGASFGGAVSIANSGQPIDGVSIHGLIIQGSASKDANLTQVSCAGTPGTLPGGNCDMNFTAVASNSANGTGTLVAGAAVFELDVTQTVGTTTTVLATKSVSITLVASVTITNLVLNSTTFTIDGSSVGWTVTINNPANSINGVVLQGEMIQGTTNRAAGGSVVVCGGGAGVLPPGTCTFSFAAVASNSNTGNGTLVPGAATFQLQLLDSDGTTTVLDTKTLDVTLVAPAPRITDVTLSSTTIVIGGAPLDYSVTIENPTSNTYSNVVVQLNLIEGGVVQASKGSLVDCGAGDGVFAPGTCSVSGQFLIPSNFVDVTPGDATLQVRLFETEAFPIEFDARNFPVTVVGSTPTITSLQLESTTITIGSFTNYTVTINNPTSSTLSIALVQGDFLQGSITNAAGGTDVICGGNSGDLPPGSCTFQFIANTSNTSTGTGGMTAGAATFRLQLNVFDTATQTTTLYDTKLVPVTLVDPPQH